jgi:hypothetical protein
MRSSYDALESLRIGGMDQFQKDFFFERQLYWDPYRSSPGLPPVQQGVLADPNYFDFISFAQYATIDARLSAPLAVYTEVVPLPELPGADPSAASSAPGFETVARRRPPSVPDAALPPLFSSRVGASLLAYFAKTFGGTALAVPPFERAAPLRSLAALCACFSLCGFSAKATAAEPSPGSFLLDFPQPATAWSGRALARKGSKCVNDFPLMAAAELVGGVRGVKVARGEQFVRYRFRIEEGGG